MLKTQKKLWLVIFTCAVYRAVHFDVVDAISTTTFLKALGRFIAKYRRPCVIYSDNGTNFKGAVNLFKKLNWTMITKNDGTTMIEWKFNVSTASWWGGFWERLIRTAKELIRRTLGMAQVTKKEFERLMATVQEVMNGRPLTYLSEDPNDLEPLTPNMFLHPYGNVSFPEADNITGDKLRFRYEYAQSLKKELRNRWRQEYLGMLVHKIQKPTRKLVNGELVVVSQDGKKRHEWNLARILELIPGKDGVCRVARIKTKDGDYMRPVQRLHPLEMNHKADKPEVDEIKTRYGRLIKRPARLGNQIVAE